MTRQLAKTVDDSLYEALRDFCGPDKAVGAVEVVISVLRRHSLRSGVDAGFLLIPLEAPVGASDAGIRLHTATP